MNRTNLKNYAPQARRDFIQAMKDRAAFFGLTADKIEPVVERGDVAVIAGREHPRAVARKLRQLEARIKKYGFEQTMEAMAYTWFNRLVAIRFMELHGYLDHGYRILSHPENKPTPEILEHAEHVELPGLKKDVVIDLKLAGNKEGELYRLLLTAQCNALHAAMPFLFERLDDETELLLPDNLLYSDSLIRKLVREIDDEDWQQVEIIGWLYQFYISEKKDEVIGKVVASEDIPAATQLFTPNWIVKYLVQNTLGRQWLATYSSSALRQQMEYYIEPAEQTPEVLEQLKAITPTSLNPEKLTLLDPACGSGHILVEAYDLFKEIYQERGYHSKDIPALILEKNLFGLEIDDRAAQLASFALMMKARADDRRIFDSEVKPNILAFEDSHGMNATDITNALNSPINKDDVPSEYLFEEIEDDRAPLFANQRLAERGHVSQADIASLMDLFENAKTFGSLIQVPPRLAAKLPEIERRLDDVSKHGDLTHAPACVIKPLIQQAQLLARQYDAVVANPPYLGSRKGMNSLLKDYVQAHFPRTKHDLFAAFTERFASALTSYGRSGLMTPFTWMFISTYEELRRLLLFENTLESLIQPEYHAFFESAYVPICAFVFAKGHFGENSTFIRLSDFYGEELQPLKALEAINDKSCSWRYTVPVDGFQDVPGATVAYWLPEAVRKVFREAKPLASIGNPRQGMATSDNDRFLRLWHEVGFNRVGLSCDSLESASSSGMKWFPYNKGGAYRKWYGNNEYVVNWENDGEELKAYAAELYGSPTRTIKNIPHYFKPCVTWTYTSSSYFGARRSDSGFVFDVSGSSAFPSPELLDVVTGFLCSSLATELLRALNPTLSFQAGNLADLPFLEQEVLAVKEDIVYVVNQLVDIARRDWDRSELSWDFTADALVIAGAATVSAAEGEHTRNVFESRQMARRLEGINNRLFLTAYGLSREYSSDVEDQQITLCIPDREQDIKRLLSYAIGCMMGRYSLDKPGLIYAHSGNQGFDASQYKTFRADDDGIIPVLETDWGIRDDAANRVVEFISVAWPKEHLEENLKFIANNLGPTTNEQPLDTIRRYLSTGFYKHHLSMYKKRPIYWLFSSGRQRAFQGLVYLHRYHDGTLARMRTEYVIPLQGQVASRIEQLEGDKAKATSTSHRNRIQKEQTDLKKKQAELIVFEEKLKHAADQKISLNLDDGVRVNYAEFDDLLAESRAITGGLDDE